MVSTMDNLCGVCFTPGEQLYQVSGYHLPPMCAKCTEAYNAKSLNFYQTISQQQTGQHITGGDQHVLATAAAAAPQPPQQQQQSAQQQQQHSSPATVGQQHQHHQQQQQQQQQQPQLQQHQLQQQQQQQQQQHGQQQNQPQQHQQQLQPASTTAGAQTPANIPSGADRLRLDESHKDSAAHAVVKPEHSDFVQKLEQSILRNGDNEVLYGEAASCTICSKTFSRKSILLAHIRNHAVDRKFVCSFCQKGFTQAANLRNHERIHRNERPFICGDCGKAFTQITNLNNHRRLHTGERPFVCIESACGRAFAQVTNLNNHMKTHHKIQQYICTQCPKKFTQVTSLNQHLLVHSGVRGFACPLCTDKSFKQQSHLTQHMKTHGVFPYKCAQCDETFVQVAQLTAHMRTHADFRYRCNVCDSAFNQESLLRKHIECHVDDGFICRQFACPLRTCNEVFADRQLLDKHLAVEHPKLAESANGSTATAVKATKTKGAGRRNKSQQAAAAAAAAAATAAAAAASAATAAAASQNHNQQTPMQQPPQQNRIISCYLDGCSAQFEHADRLSEHLIVAHNMLYKDVETRNKMNLMFLEQIKHQMTEQYVMSGMMGGHFAHQPLAHEQFAVDPANALQQQQHQHQLQQQQQQQAQQIKTENHDDGSSRTHKAVNGGKAIQQAQLHHQGDGDGGVGGRATQFNGSGGYTVCTVCYNVFKNVKTLTRHMFRFHGNAQF